MAGRRGSQSPSRSGPGPTHRPLPPLCMPHPVTSQVGRGTFPASDAEAQPLLTAHQTGHVALEEGPRGLRLEQGQPQPSSSPLPGTVVILRPQRRGGDGVLGLHHALSPQPHLHGSTCPPQRLDGLVVLSVLQGYAIHLQTWRVSGQAVASGQ